MGMKNKNIFNFGVDNWNRLKLIRMIDKMFQGIAAMNSQQLSQGEKDAHRPFSK